MNINETTKPVSITGEEKTWDRARFITIDNTYGKIPTLTFTDDRITVGPLGEKHQGLPAIKMKFDNPEEEFDLLHPLTDQKIGTAKLQDLQVILYSLYVYEKNKALSAKPTDSVRPAF